MDTNKKILFTFALILILFLGMSFLTIQKNWFKNDEPHTKKNLKTLNNPSPISIDGNADFSQTASEKGWDGDGTYGNPYIIENFTIYATSDGNGIEIRNTDVHFVIRDVSVLDGKSNYNFGFYFTNISNGVIYNCTAENNIAGFVLKNSTKTNFSANNAVNNDLHGFRIWNCLNNTLENNVANENGQYGFYIDNNDNEILANNTLSKNIAENNEINGFYLENTSNNALTDNVANYQPKGKGFSLLNANNNTLRKNTAQENQDGFYLFNSNNNTLINNSANINTENGFYVENSNNNTLIHNTAHTNNLNGVYLLNSFYISIINNTAESNSKYGLFLSAASNNILTSNIVSDNQVGIYLAESPDNTITNNSLSNNGLFIHSEQLKNSYQLSVENNTVNEKPFIFAQNSTTDLISAEAGQIILLNCSSLQIKNNSIDKTTVGISLLFSRNITLRGNTVFNNSLYGFYLFNSDNNTLTENTANNNAKYGIYLKNSDNNLIIDNFLLRNELGPFLDEGTGNVFKNNIDNGDAYIPGEPVHIENNRQFEILAEASGWKGSGTFGDPYIFEGYEISATQNHGVIIQNTDIHFVIKDVTVANGNSDNYGFYLKNVKNGELKESSAYNNRYGIYIKNSYDLIIRNNNFGNNINGVFLNTSYNNKLLGNGITGNRHGFMLKGSYNNSIRDNIVSNNIYLGISLSSSYNNTFVRNTATGNLDGFLLSFSDNNTFTGNTANANDHHGFHLWHSDHNNLVNNTASKNEKYGIYLEESYSNILLNNTLEDNGLGGVYKEFDQEENYPDVFLIASIVMVIALAILGFAKLIQYIRKRQESNSEKNIRDIAEKEMRSPPLNSNE